MFKAVRDRIFGVGHRIAASWRELRAKGMVTLFLFEFSVVLLGVLAAQGLANWFRERDARQRMTNVVAQLDRDVASAHHYALIWNAAIPCLRDRVTEVMQSAATGTNRPTASGDRPLFWITSAEPVSEEVRLAMHQELREEDVLSYLDTVERVIAMRGLSTDLANEWEQFVRIDPAFGPVSQGDRDAVREAGGRMRSILRTMQINSGNMIEIATSLGIKAEQVADLTEPRRPARGCSEVWQYGAIAIPIDGKLDGRFYDRLNRNTGDAKGPEAQR